MRKAPDPLRALKNGFPGLRNTAPEPARAGGANGTRGGSGNRLAPIPTGLAEQSKVRTRGGRSIERILHRSRAARAFREGPVVKPKSGLSSTRFASLKTEPLMSLVLPVREQSKVIGRTLKRLAAYCAQNGLQVEILVVDDGSKDDT